jgi:hypothetical protein
VQGRPDIAKNPDLENVNFVIMEFSIRNISIDTPETALCQETKLSANQNVKSIRRIIHARHSCPLSQKMGRYVSMQLMEAVWIKQDYIN